MNFERPIAHRLYFSDLAAVVAGACVVVDGDEANHAVRVKRVRAGEMVGLFDGRGVVAWGQARRAESGKRAVLEVVVGGVERVGRVSPRVEVWCPPPKGDRLEGMIEQLSQVGVAGWRALRAARGEREAFRPERLERAAVEAAKQCGRAWVLEIGAWMGFDEALEDARAVVADASGVAVTAAGLPGTEPVALLIGPEGGWTPDELGQARATGRRVVRFGVHVMRIETAALAAAACLLSNGSEGGA